MEMIGLLLGEKREITLHTSVGDGRPYTIRNPVYELSLYGQCEASGDCDLNGPDLLVTIQPEKRGTYTLEYTFVIAQEIIKKQIGICVS